MYRFPERERPVPVIELDSISDITVAPEGFCAVNPADWFEWQKAECHGS